MNHGTSCPSCGSGVKSDQAVCGNCRYHFSSVDENEEPDWDPDDRVTLAEKDEPDEEEDFDFDDDGGGVIMEDDPNAKRESFDGEQEDEWDDEEWDEEDYLNEDSDPEGGESDVDGRGDD